MDSISSIFIESLRISPSYWMHFGSSQSFKNGPISSRLLNLCAQSCSCFSLVILLISAGSAVQSHVILDTSDLRLFLSALLNNLIDLSKNKHFIGFLYCVLFSISLISSLYCLTFFFFGFVLFLFFWFPELRLQRFSFLM